MKEILDVIHKTIYQFFDVCGDDEEVPMSDKDKLLLEVNKAICNNLKALEPCEDAISRQAVLALITEYQKGFDAVMNIGGKVSMEELADDIKLLNSSVTPQPKTGHWILTDDDFVYCSECEDSYYPRPIDASWYYCPHCGAKMRGE